MHRHCTVVAFARWTLSLPRAPTGHAIPCGVVDGGKLLGQVVLNTFLEVVTGQRKKRRDPLLDDAVLLHEVLPGPFRQPEPQESLTLFKADELRNVRGRQP